MSDRPLRDREIRWAERIATLELKVELMAETNEEIKNKLDELLTLKSKGMGAMWLASAILGTGILGIGVFVFNWIKGI